MIYLRLFLAFLEIGAFSFGGAYGAIPLIRETVLANGWLDAEAVANIIAVSESTPGPIMVNMATFVGAQQGGVAGAAAATLGVVLPSFVIILLIAAAFSRVMKYRGLQSAMNGVKPGIIGIIIATGAYMLLSQTVLPAAGDAGAAVAVLLLCCVSMAAWRLIRGRALPPIALIGLSALFGIALF